MACAEGGKVWLNKMACAEGTKVCIDLGNPLIFLNRSVVKLEYEYGMVHFVVMECLCRHTVGCVAQRDWNMPG